MDALIQIFIMLANTANMLVIIWFIIGLLFSFNVIGRDNTFFVAVHDAIARLFEPVGMKSMVPEFDARGTLLGSSLMHGTARDWAKFGEFLRNGGAVKGAQVVPRGWIEFMTTPSPRNPGYGAQVWLNRPQPSGESVLFPGRAPASAFACVGHLGQYVFVSPRQKLTVVRLGMTNGADRPELIRRLGDVAALFPAS